jgi:outer membrane protein assembly factor BamB
MGGTVDDALGSSNVMVTKLSGSDGNALWTKEFGGSDLDFLHGLAVDGAGDVYISGEYFKPIDFGGGALPAPTARSSYVAKLRGSDGSHVWSLRRHEGGLGGGVAVSSSGALFVVAQEGNLGGRLARLSPSDGSELWMRRVGVAPTLDLSSDGNPIASSELRITFDPGFGPLVSRGKHDVMVSKLAAADGAHLWSVRLGGPGMDGFAGVAPVGPDDFYVSGQFEGSLELVGRVLTSNGGTGDGFIARVQP